MTESKKSKAPKDASPAVTSFPDHTLSVKLTFILYINYLWSFNRPLKQLKKEYNNRHIHIPRIDRKIRRLLECQFPELMKCRRKYDPFHILEAIFYLLRSGCQWRMIPESYPRWKSVYDKLRYRNAKGIFERIHAFLVKNARKASGRNEYPTVCFIDSASRRSGLSDSIKGIDGFKKIKGIKRHVITDSQGNILHVITTCANVNDGKASLEMMPAVKNKYPTLKEIRADKGYLGEDIIREAGNQDMAFTCTKSNGGGALFIPAQGRWVSERTFAWLDNCRRLARNYERICQSATDMTIAADVYRLLRYL